MTPESLIQFKNLKNRTGEDLVGMILYALSEKSDEGNAKLETISMQLARGEEEEGLREMEERMDRRAAQEVLAGIKEAIEGKNIDLSEVLAGLVMIAKEVRQGSDEAKALLQSIESKEHTDITGALSLIYEKMCEEKMENPVDYTPIIESQKQGFDDVVRVLTELAFASKEKRESESVKVEGEVNIAKPSWWKEYVLDWKPLEKLLVPIKNALEKLLEKETQELPIKDGRVLVSLDRRVGGVSGNPFKFDKLGNLNVINENYAQKITVSGNDTYVAIAQIGTQQSEAKWLVKKISVVGNDTTITWAGNGDFNQIATDLTTLTYL